MGLLEVEPSCLGVTAGGSGVGASRVAAHCSDRLLSEPKAGTQPLRREPLLMLRVFGRLPITDVTRYSEAGVRKASGEETAGEFAPTLVSIYGEFAAAA